MANPRSIEVKVGLLILIAIGILTGFIILMGGLSFKPTYDVHVDFDNPGGIQAGAPVRIAGVTVGKINNQAALVQRAFKRRSFFSDTTAGEVHPTEEVAMLVCEADSFVDGIKNAQDAIEGSCSMLLLTDQGIFAARDRLGRTPLTIGCRDGAVAVSSETCAFPNLGYNVDHCLGPGEVIRMSPDGWEQQTPPGERMQVSKL